jgi:hypothetical protein
MILFGIIFMSLTIVALIFWLVSDWEVAPGDDPEMHQFWKMRTITIAMGSTGLLILFIIMALTH